MTSIARKAYAGSVQLLRRTLRALGIPVPRVAKRANRAIEARMSRRRAPDLRSELRALTRRVEDLEATAYLDRVGRPRD